MRPAAADTAGSSPSPAVPRPGSAPTARRRCCRALHGWRPARGRAARSPDGHRLHGQHLGDRGGIGSSTCATPAGRLLPAAPDRVQTLVTPTPNPTTSSANVALAQVGQDEQGLLPRVQLPPGRGDRGGCVRVPGASAGGPDGGAAGGPGVGAVRRGRSPAASRRCRACMPTWSRGGIAGAGQPGAARPADAAGERVEAVADRATGAGAADAAEDLAAAGGGPAGRGAAHAPGPGDGAGDGAGRAAPVRGAGAAVAGRAGR